MSGSGRSGGCYVEVESARAGRYVRYTRNTRSAGVKGSDVRVRAAWG